MDIERYIDVRRTPWHSSCHSNDTTAVLFMVPGMQQRLDERADGLAIVDEFGRWTWREFNGRVNH